MSGRVLVVDDEQVLRLTFEALLGDAGHAVQTAADFDQAVAALEADAFDAVFVDIILGGRSGLELLERAKGLQPTTPVVMITGQPTVEAASRALRLGAFDFMVKPVTKDALLRAARAALAHKRLIDERDHEAAQRRRYQALLTAIVEGVGDGVISVGVDGRLSQINRAAQELLGLTSQAALGSSLEEPMWAPLGQGRQMLLATARGGSAPAEARQQIVPAGAGPRLVELSCRPLRDGQGRAMGAVLVLRDRTRLSLLEDSLRSRRGLHGLVGQSPAMQEVYRLLETLAETDTTVLIGGPSGSGKELAAEALHYLGPRANGPLIKVNCAALAENLLESELFGHARGAFTGAVADKAGRFLLADGGTIMLDEIGDISPAVQLKLLRVLEDKIVERVGEAKPRRVDARVVAATNQDLATLSAQGRFRQDLYYRLNVVRLNMPSLAQRREDIPLLAEHFLAQFARRMPRPVEGLSPTALEALMRQPWPGNVRQLRHVLEHAYIFCPGGLIGPEHLPPELSAPPISPAADGPTSEAQRILAALRRAGGNKAKAARLLGLSRNTLYRKLNELGLSELGDGSE
ncbi:PAS modulated sigma54 specific transcriptional regulator, Fis family [Desulfarculus baarsii DSM 2075]|uniref:PAS modulated sigma54 specific transcriptional regulator, Fis family n=1 Tax=Desulfarculus baarsii (strain ATCC 33931 / DSM 2075 / LMG 7858 / VKM B-1802 / 2st14) TaxID=644282 RepID=E1QMF4_DESB2|nr:sigma-54-dependent Fis family transcriptional regulator [Desulfarculus baarsii]ADK86197.1 PAS modulated sigma54 specific transcriptional regulator, Fis family [Desulfarculus baarsii DSM 2075]